MTMFENENPIMPIDDDGEGGTGGAVTLAIEAIDQRDYSNTHCLATCYLVIARYFHPDDNITMSDLEDDGIVASNGYVYNSANTYFTCSSADYSASSVRNALANGYPVIVGGMNSAGGSHYVVAYGYTGTTIRVMDPWRGVKGTLGNTTLVTPTTHRICRP